MLNDFHLNECVTDIEADSELVGWWDYCQDALHWVSLPHVRPEHAAALLCCQNPDARNFSPEQVSTDQTSPLDYQRLVRLFSAPEFDTRQSRSLKFWLGVAKSAGYKYHSWIDEYVSALDRLGIEPGVSVEATTKKPGFRHTDLADLPGLLQWKRDIIKHWPTILNATGGRPTARKIASFLVKKGCLEKGSKPDSYIWHTTSNEPKELTLKTILNSMPNLQDLLANGNYPGRVPD